MISGTVAGLASVVALLLASIALAVLDKREKGKGNAERSRFLSRMALGLFLAAFAGGVVVALVGGVQPRAEEDGIAGRMGAATMGEGTMPPMASIGQIDEAEFQQLTERVKKDPRDVRARERLGHLYLQKQDFENVFRMAHEALQLDPQSVESRVHMGMVFFAMQQTEQALEQFDKALSLDPKNEEALRFKAMVSNQLQ